MSSDPTMNRLLQLLGEIDQRLGAFDEETKRARAEIVRQRESVQETIGLISGDHQVSIAPGLPEVDFSGAKNALERLQRIASAGDGTVNTTSAANQMIIAGASSAKKSNLVSTLYSAMSESPEWEKVAPGTFRYIGNGEERRNGQAQFDALPRREEGID